MLKTAEPMRRIHKPNEKALPLTAHPTAYAGGYIGYIEKFGIKDVQNAVR